MFAAHGIQAEYQPVKNAQALINVHSYPQTASASQPATAMAMYQIEVPAGVQSGQQFQANVGGTMMTVQCPTGQGPGSLIQVQAPAQTAPAVAVATPISLSA